MVAFAIYSAETLRVTMQQQRVLDAIVSLTAVQSHSPSVREIANHIGVNSTSTVNLHLNALKRKGFIRWTPGKSRTIVVVSK